jgi:hypothetical protein
MPSIAIFFRSVLRRTSPFSSKCDKLLARPPGEEDFFEPTLDEPFNRYSLGGTKFELISWCGLIFEILKEPSRRSAAEVCQPEKPSHIPSTVVP